MKEEEECNSSCLLCLDYTQKEGDYIAFPPDNSNAPIGVFRKNGDPALWISRNLWESWKRRHV